MSPNMMFEQVVKNELVLYCRRKKEKSVKPIKPPQLKPEDSVQEVLDRQPETVAANLGKDPQVHCSRERMGGVERNGRGWEGIRWEG